MTAPTPTYFKRVFGPSYCDDCGQEGCRKLSVCCGAEAFENTPTCSRCCENTGFECEEEPTLKVAVFGSPRNANHSRKCGCQIKFRQAAMSEGTLTKWREDTGYDVFACATHEAAPGLLAALEDLTYQVGLLESEESAAIDTGEARAAIARAKAEAVTA